MRLLVISQDFPPTIGGIQTYAFELAKRLHSECSSFAVIAPWSKGCEAFDSSVPFAVVRIKTPLSLFPFRLIPVIRQFKKTNGLDWVFNVQWPSAIGSYLARRTGLSFRTAIAAHGRELLIKPFKTKPANSFRHWVLGKTLADASVVLPVSNYTSSIVTDIGVQTRNVQVVHNGADIEHFRRFSSNGHNGSAKTILTVCRLVPRKGIDTVIRSLPAVAQQVPNIKYVIAGDGPDMARLTDLVEDLGVESLVTFVGAVAHSNLPELYNHCDVFVMPSRGVPPDIEGFGIVFLEANACGKPVIGARTGGIPDAIVDGETGLLIDPDNVQQLASAIIQTVGDREFAEELGRNGFDRVRSTGSWDHVAAKVIQILSVDKQ
jgi:phosphatidylinositol alpha-1,6-mannosyltransferase